MAWAEKSPRFSRGGYQVIPAEDTLVDHAYRSQVYLERLKQGIVDKQEVMLQRTDQAIREALASGVGDRQALTKALVDTDAALDRVYAQYTTELTNDMADLGQAVAQYETAFLNSLIPPATAAGVAQFIAPSLQQLITAYKTEPLMAKGVGIGGGGLLDTMLADYGKHQKDSLTGIIRQGYSQGLSMDEIIRQIRGTKANGYRDGALQALGRQAESVVRTGIQHIAETARQEVYNNNDDLVIGYQWLSTLDNKTSEICRSLDGRKFLNADKGAKPKPPAHIRCRSTTIPVLSPEFDWLDEGGTRAARDPKTGKTIDAPADITYYEWLKKQPADYQREVLGATRYKLFADGGMTANEFGRLNLNRAFQPMTIKGRFDDDGNLIEEGLIHKMPGAFKKAGLL